MAQRELVSVIIPCFNYGKYLREAITSVLDQSYGSVEVVVVNDGSTDDSLEVARSFGDSIRLIDQQNQGRSTARNVGIEAARGTFIKFLDADDKLDPRCIQLQVDRMGSEDSLNEARTMVFYDESDEVCLHEGCVPEVDMWWRLSEGYAFPAGGPLVRKEALGPVRYRPQIWFGEDNLFWSDLWLRLGKPQRLPFVEDAVAYIRFHETNSWRQSKPVDRLKFLIPLIDSWGDYPFSRPEVKDVCVTRLERNFRQWRYANAGEIRVIGQTVRVLSKLKGVSRPRVVANFVGWRAQAAMDKMKRILARNPTSC